MEDRYLFKAKDCNSIWRIGLLIALQGDRCAIEEKDGSKWACNSNTLCQCTGLKDKNGKLIWENDIVEVPDEDGYFFVGWQEDRASFVMDGDGLIVDFDNYWSCDIEVVGDKFANQELLEVQE